MIFCLSLLSTGITGVCYYVSLVVMVVTHHHMEKRSSEDLALVVQAVAWLHHFTHLFDSELLPGL